MGRQIAALFVADAVGFSRLMEEDEATALRAIKASRRIIDSKIKRYKGQIIQTAGDSVIAMFPGAVSAVEAAQSIQNTLAASKIKVFTFRIGLHFGDVEITENDVLGDGLNLAARLEPLSPPGGICISGVVADQIVGKIDGKFTQVGRRKLKNIKRAVEIYCWPENLARQMRNTVLAFRWAVGTGVAALAALILAIFVYASMDTTPSLPTGPRIVVLPFEEIGKHPDEAYFAAGLSRDINAYLSKFSNLFVYSPSTTETLRGKNCEEIRSELETDFILAGTIQRTDDKIRVTTSFTNARDCRQLDSPGPYDSVLSAETILDVQLEIARKVVAEIGSADAPIFDKAIIRELENKATEDLAAYECILLSYWFYENFDPERHRRARDCSIQAVQTDPGYSLGWSRLAFAYIESKKYSIDTKSDWAERAWEAAQKAIDLDPQNPNAYYALAIRGQMQGEDRSIFQNYANKAIKLNPNDSFVLADLGTWMAYSGEWEKGKEWIERAKNLNPKHQSWWNWPWQLHAYLQGEYVDSIEYAQIVNLPGNFMVQAALAAAYAMNGDLEKANETLETVLELKPDYANDPEQPFRARGMQQESIDKIMEGLLRAGLHEQN